MQSRFFLGCDDRLCFQCFLLWYDCGMTNKAEMARVRREQLAEVLSSSCL
jgi:hypothetical protein